MAAISQKPSPSTGVGAVIDVLAGAAAGIFARTIVAPVDRVKLILQVRGSIIPCCGTCRPNKVIQSQSAWQVGRAIIREEGFVSLWRGNVPIVLIQAGTSALNFMFMEQYKIAAASAVSHLSDKYPSMREEGGRSQRFVSSFLSGGLAGATTISFLYPLGFVRTRLAVDVGNAAKHERIYPNGMRDVLRSIWCTDGLRGFYKGYGISLASVTVYRVVYLGGYDFLKSEMKVKSEGGDQSSLSQKFLAAQSVSIAASLSYYPLDSIRRRLMMEAGRSDQQRLYRSSMHCFRQIVKEEGFRGFYLGIGPDLVRSVGAALVLVSYDEIKKLLY